MQLQDVLGWLERARIERVVEVPGRPYATRPQPELTGETITLLTLRGSRIGHNS